MASYDANENDVSTTSARRSPDVLDAILTCSQCKESVKGKSSKLLSCLHTVCGSCHIAHTDGKLIIYLFIVLLLFYIMYFHLQVANSNVGFVLSKVRRRKSSKISLLMESIRKIRR